MNYILSIILPTFNSAHYLDENLKVLIPQFQKYSNQVELCIFDNASDDGTKEIVEKYMMKGSFESFSYIYRSRNIGSIANIIDGANRANGQFIMLLGDDDILSPNFLDIVLPVLSINPDLGIFHFNRIGCMPAFNIDNKLFNKKMLDTPIEYYSDFSDFVKVHLTEPTFMSSLLFSKKCWERGESYVKDSYYGYMWFSRIMNGAVNMPCLYYYFPLVLQRSPQIQKWSKMGALYTIVGVSNFFIDLDLRVSGIYKKWQIVLSQERDIYSLLIKVREDRSFYKERYREFTPYLSFGQRLFMLSFLHIPFFFSSLFVLTPFRVYRKIKAVFK